MSSRRIVTLVLVTAVLSVLVPGAPPAMAFTEDNDESFFGQGAGAANTGANNSFFGIDAGASNSSGAGNSFFGWGAGALHTTGSDNSFFGMLAGDSSSLSGSAGSRNSFFGQAAGLSNIASDNAFFGQGAGQANTTGTRNALFGQNAGVSNTASDNAFFGQSTGSANTSGNSNAFFGQSAGSANVTGSFNAFFGEDAGFSNRASFNAFFGEDAGFTNTTGGSNAFFGQGAGQANSSACCNSFFGQEAGSLNTTGTANSFFGADSGLSNTTGVANTFLGAFSDGAAGITNATALGHRTQVSQSDSLVLGSINGVNGATSSVNVGIGNTAPKQVLHLTDNGAARFRIENVANGAVWDFQSSGGGGSFVIDRVGGPVSLDFELQPDGDAIFRGTATATSFITSSDRNLKTDITPANAAKLMRLLRQLDIATWRFKSEPETTVNLGPMAQDFNRLFGMGTRTTIQIRDLAALALVAAQSLDKQNTDLIDRVERLEKLVASSGR